MVLSARKFCRNIFRARRKVRPPLSNISSKLKPPSGISLAFNVDCFTSARPACDFQINVSVAVELLLVVMSLVLSSNLVLLFVGRFGEEISVGGLRFKEEELAIGKSSELRFME